MSNLVDDWCTSLAVLESCSAEKLQKFAHKLSDAICGQRGPNVGSFEDVWNLEDYWAAADLVRDICLYGTSHSVEQLSSRLSDLGPEKQKVLLDVIATRKNDMQSALLEKTAAISDVHLKDFDWQCRLSLSSDKLGVLNVPLASVDLNLEARGEGKRVMLEMDEKELGKLLVALDGANKAVRELT